MALLGLACGGDDGTRLDATRFGQSGEVRVIVVSPLALGAGELQQVLTWNSSGAWQLFESISYRDLLGDDHVRRSPGDPRAFSGAYAQLITHVNETAGLKLFGEVDPELIPPPCGETRSRVTFQLRDETRGEELRWIRCGERSLAGLSPVGAGPDPAASRVMAAAQLTREFTVSSSSSEPFRSAYEASVPFGTLDRGEESRARLTGPRVFMTTPPGDPGPPDGWEDFWRSHTGREGAPPTVDWTGEMVIVGAVGERFEAGDSVEIRRILPVADGTLVELVERVPGDFCSPAARRHVPFHIVVAPRAPPAVRFSDVAVERVPCGAG